MAKATGSWGLLLRYQAQAERNYRRAVEEFERLKALRHELPSERAMTGGRSPPEMKMDEILGLR